MEILVPDTPSTIAVPTLSGGEYTAISWADLTHNAWRGCARVSPACRFCLAPETRVLYADMTWRPIGEVRVGDELVGFTETPALGVNRVVERSVVEAVWRTEQPTVELTVGDRTIVASAEHRWLTDQARPTWKTTEELALGMTLKTLGWPAEEPDRNSADYRAGYIAGVTTGDGTMRWSADWTGPVRDHPQVYWRVAVNANDRAILDRLVDYLAGFGVDVEIRDFNGGPRAKPMLKVETRSRVKLARIAEVLCERVALDWQAGWLAGMFDTDGSYSGSDKYTTLRIAQRKDNGALAAVERYAANLGYAMKVERHAGCPTARLHGRVDTHIGFLTRISPALERKCAAFYGRRLFGPAVEVNGVRRGPVRELVDIQTSARTFIAEGVATHNCYAADMSRRFDDENLWLRNGPRKPASERQWALPDVWNRRALRIGRRLTVFAGSMMDVFEAHPQLPPLRRRLWGKVAAYRNLIWMLTTKNIENAADMVPAEWMRDGFPENVWVIATVENQKYARERIPILRDLPITGTRGVSCEPLLEDVDLAQWIGPRGKGIDWIIGGGGSGRDKRRTDLAWFRHLRDDAYEGGADFHLKQLGQVLAGELGATGKGDQPHEWPVDLRHQDIPDRGQLVAA